MSRKLPDLPEITDPNDKDQFRARNAARQRQRWKDDPEYREKRLESNKRWKKRNAGKAEAAVKDWRNRLKLEVFQAYSGLEEPVCSCCGQSGLAFLTLDHVNNDGGEHRKQMKGRLHYLYLKQEGFPRQGEIVVMCWNCNCGRKANGGICPHKQINQS